MVAVVPDDGPGFADDGDAEDLADDGPADAWAVEDRAAEDRAVEDWAVEDWAAEGRPDDEFVAEVDLVELGAAGRAVEGRAAVEERAAAREAVAACGTGRAPATPAGRPTSATAAQLDSPASKVSRRMILPGQQCEQGRGSGKAGTKRQGSKQCRGIAQGRSEPGRVCASQGILQGRGSFKAGNRGRPIVQVGMALSRDATHHLGRM